MSLDQRQAAPPGHLPGASARSGALTDSLDGADGTTAISISEVSKAFGHGKTTVHALDRVSLDVTLGEFVCLIGASGCGKSTLLSLVAGLDTPTARHDRHLRPEGRAHVPGAGPVPVADRGQERRTCAAPERHGQEGPP